MESRLTISFGFMLSISGTVPASRSTSPEPRRPEQLKMTRFDARPTQAPKISSCLYIESVEDMAARFMYHSLLVPHCSTTRKFYFSLFPPEDTTEPATTRSRPFQMPPSEIAATHRPDDFVVMDAEDDSFCRATRLPQRHARCLDATWMPPLAVRSGQQQASGSSARIILSASSSRKRGRRDADLRQSRAGERNFVTSRGLTGTDCRGFPLRFTTKADTNNDEIESHRNRERTDFRCRRHFL